MRIGRIVRVLEDKKRKEVLVDTNENRKVIISCYYPIDEMWKKKEQAFYKDIYSPKEDEFIKKFKEIVPLEDDQKENFLRNIPTNIYNDAPINDRNTAHPVIIQLTGLGSPRDYLTFNIEKLVREGYVVITIGHPYESMLTIFPNGEIVEPIQKELTQEDKIRLTDIRKDDLSFILDELNSLNQEDSVIKGRLDLNCIGVIGHSLGGAAAFKAAQVDKRIKALVLFDAALQLLNLETEITENKHLNTPTLNLRRGTYNYADSMKMFINYLKENSDDKTFKSQVILYDSVLRDSDIQQKYLFNYLSGYKSFVKIKSTTHMTFTDYSIIRGAKMESEELSVEKAYNLINDRTSRFFNEFLCGKKGVYSKELKEDEYITKIDDDCKL